MAFILVSVSGYRHNNNSSSLIKFDRRIEEIVGDVMKDILFEATNEISYTTMFPFIETDNNQHMDEILSTQPDSVIIDRLTQMLAVAINTDINILITITPIFCFERESIRIYYPKFGLARVYKTCKEITILMSTSSVPLTLTLTANRSLNSIH
jgi:hypothetical protein